MHINVNQRTNNVDIMFNKSGKLLIYQGKFGIKWFLDLDNEKNKISPKVLVIILPRISTLIECVIHF